MVQVLDGRSASEQHAVRCGALARALVGLASVHGVRRERRERHHCLQLGFKPWVLLVMAERAYEAQIMQRRLDGIEASDAHAHRRVEVLTRDLQVARNNLAASQKRLKEAQADAAKASEDAKAADAGRERLEALEKLSRHKAEALEREKYATAATAKKERQAASAMRRGVVALELHSGAMARGTRMHLLSALTRWATLTLYVLPHSAHLADASEEGARWHGGGGAAGTDGAGGVLPHHRVGRGTFGAGVGCASPRVRASECVSPRVRASECASSRVRAGEGASSRVRAGEGASSRLRAGEGASPRVQRPPQGQQSQMEQSQQQQQLQQQYHHQHQHHHHQVQQQRRHGDGLRGSEHSGVRGADGGGGFSRAARDRGGAADGLRSAERNTVGQWRRYDDPLDMFADDEGVQAEDQGAAAYDGTAEEGYHMDGGYGVAGDETFEEEMAAGGAHCDAGAAMPAAYGGFGNAAYGAGRAAPRHAHGGTGNEPPMPMSHRSGRELRTPPPPRRHANVHLRDRDDYEDVSNFSA